jgi:hypothetical protein
MSALLVFAFVHGLGCAASGTTSTTTPDGEVVDEAVVPSDESDAITADDLVLTRVGEDLALSTTIALVSAAAGTVLGIVAGGLVASPAIGVLVLFLSQPLGPGAFPIVTLLAAASFVPALLVLMLAPAIGIFVEVAVVLASIYVTHGRDESASALALGTGFPAGGVTVFTLLAAGVIGLWGVSAVLSSTGTPPVLASLPPVVSTSLVFGGVAVVGGAILLAGSLAGAAIGMTIAWPDEDDVRASIDEDDPRVSPDGERRGGIVR